MSSLSPFSLPRIDLLSALSIGRALLTTAELPPRLPGAIPSLRRLLAARFSALVEARGGPRGGALHPRALEAFTLALHAYVAGVSAELADGEPESEALAEVLLAPVELVALGIPEPRAADPTLESIRPPAGGPMDLAWDEPQPLEMAC